MRGRRRFLRLLGGLAAEAAAFSLRAGRPRTVPHSRPSHMSHTATPVSVFLCGDVMTGRAIDQILPHPSKPALHESYVHDARGYLALAERASGDIPHPAPFAYVWGDALAELERRRPAARIVNLETSVTRSDTAWPKGINYRMHPGNVGCLTAARHRLLRAGQQSCARLGARRARRNACDAAARADRDGRRRRRSRQTRRRRPSCRWARARACWCLPLQPMTAACPRSGPRRRERAGVHRLPDLSKDTVARHRRPRASPSCRPAIAWCSRVHWGGNWGYAVPARNARSRMP